MIKRCLRARAGARAWCVAWCSLWAMGVQAAPTVSRLTPPSEWFSTGRTGAPQVARFLPGQRFDLQATVRLDAGQTLRSFRFLIDGQPWAVVPGTTSAVTQGLDLPAGVNAVVVSQRAVSLQSEGVHRFAVEAVQSDGQVVKAEGELEVVPLRVGGRPVRNLVFVLGDGMGVSHRTAARVVSGQYAQGKARQRLEMDQMPHTALVMTSSLDSVVTDSSPGMSNYFTGNKAANNMEGVFPDDTLDAFDNPRVEYLTQYLHRTRGTQLGIVTTADVFDATPAATAIHTANRSAGTGIVDQFLDERARSGLQVLMGGGRRWFLPRLAGTAGLNGSQRDAKTDHVLPEDVAKGWGVPRGQIDPNRDLIADFKQAGFAYAHDAGSLKDVARPGQALLGLFAFGNMNVAYDKVMGRRGRGTVVQDFGLPNQPMLDEMTEAALTVLKDAPQGFVLLVEGASIDKQSHAMDSERWLMDMLELDRAVGRAKAFAAARGDTLVVVTADHETAGTSVIGALKTTMSELKDAAKRPTVKHLRDDMVGIYDDAKFPAYVMAPDGYPVETDVDGKVLIGYGANADRYENWQTSALPLRDGAHPYAKQAPVANYPTMATRHAHDGFMITGHVPGGAAVHTAADVPLSAVGPGAEQFHGVMDNTDVFFVLAQALRGEAATASKPVQPSQSAKAVKGQSRSARPGPARVRSASGVAGAGVNGGR